MSTKEQDALDAWRIYAPRFELHLETAYAGYEVTAHDKARCRWFTIAWADDPADAMLAGCRRVHGETPHVVAHLELTEIGERGGT